MKSFYHVEMAMSGGVYRDAAFTYSTLTELQQALEFELWTDLRGQEATYLFGYSPLPLQTYIAGRLKDDINLLPFIKIRGADGTEFTLHEEGAYNNFTYGTDEATIKGTDVVVDDDFLASAVLFIDWGAVPVVPLEAPQLAIGEKAEYESEYRGEVYRETFEYGYFDAETHADEDCDADFRERMDQELAIDPDWLKVNDGAVLALAEQMHATRDYSAMPILADALEEAGCESELILWHCRGPACVHVRGSWLIERLRAAAGSDEEDEEEE